MDQTRTELSDTQAGVLWMLQSSPNLALRYRGFKWRYVALPQGWVVGKPSPGACESLAQRNLLQPVHPECALNGDSFYRASSESAAALEAR